MWDFLLVLGYVPGTNFQITFGELVAFILIFSALIYTYKKLPLKRQKRLVHRFKTKLIKSAKRRLKRQRKTAGKLIRAYMLKLRPKKAAKKARGIAAPKLHTRQRTA